MGPLRRSPAAVLLSVLALTFALSPARAQAPTQPTLVAFRSEREVADFLRSAATVIQRREAARRAVADSVAVAHAAQLKRQCQEHPTLSLVTSASGRGPATIRVRVHEAATDSTGLSSAYISLVPLGLTATTDASGFATVVIPADSLTARREVTVLVRRIGYDAQTHPLTVRAGDHVAIDVAPCQAALQLSGVTVGSAVASVTNTQHDGVDEGGIVKRAGDFLVILRRGRLFTVDASRGRLRPIAAVDAFAPGVDPDGTWYDELLIAGDKVVVLGYSYERGGTELGVFRLSPSGALRYQATYHLRSNDYYSSENYATRLIGTQLILYTPVAFPADPDHPLDALPALRRWDPKYGGHAQRGFRSLAMARRIFRPAGDVDPSELETLHVVTTCDLATPELTCSSTVVLGGSARVFYVSPTAVYVSAHAWRAKGWRAQRATQRLDDFPSMLYRLPLDGGRPAALHTVGTPIDQFSFLEENRRLNVLMMADGYGDGMWQAEGARGGAIALLQVPLASFGKRDDAPREAYRPLPEPEGTDAMQNRFVGRYVLYGRGNSWWQPHAIRPMLYAAPVAGGAVTALQLAHGADRIEALGTDALIVGADTADLHFTAVRLGAAPAVAQHHVVPQAAQGELRSHGFFFRPDPWAQGAGLFGLPVARASRPGFAHLFETSASVLFVKTDSVGFDPLGELAARPDSTADDACRASCVDWYGNSRPLFFDGRIVALLGYELVEGRLRHGRIEETRRSSFAPRRSPAPRAGS